MPEPSLGRVVGAFLRRDLGEESTAKFGLAVRTVSMLFALASFAYLARFVDAGGGALAPRYGNAGYFGFFLLGIAAADLFHAVVMALSSPIRDAQLQGTLEAMLSTPAPAAYVLLGTASSSVIFGAVRLVVYLVAGVVLFGVRFGPVNVATLAITLPLAVAAFASLGLLGGAITMRLRRTDPLTALIVVATGLIGGVLYPVDLLPRPLALLSYGLPIAPALEALRRALFAGAAPSELGRELLALAVFVAIVAPVAVIVFARALRRARDDGSLAHY